jgi:hypothetical protein
LECKKDANIQEKKKGVSNLCPHLPL